MKRKIQQKQKIIGLLAGRRLTHLVLLFIVGYLLISVIFGIIYCAGDYLVPSPSDRFTYFYFSFITQATVGYGDYSPINEGRIFSCIQVLIGLVWFGVGTAILVMKIITPAEEAIIFDRFLAYDPIERRYRIRFANLLPVDLHNVSIDMRLRRTRITEWGHKKTSRRTVSMLGGRITRLPSMRPFLSSTRPPDSAEYAPPGSIILTPSEAILATSFEVVITAQYFAGTMVATHLYSQDDVVTGVHTPTYEGDEAVNWSNWERITPVSSEEEIKASTVPSDKIQMSELAGEDHP